MLEKNELIGLAILLKRFGDEDNTKWLKEEQQIVEETFNVNSSELNSILREISYDEILRKILRMTDKGNF